MILSQTQLNDKVYEAYQTIEPAIAWMKHNVS